MNRKQVNDTVKKLMSFQENVKDGDLREILFNMQDNVSKVKLLSLIIWKFVIERGIMNDHGATIMLVMNLRSSGHLEIRETLPRGIGSFPDGYSAMLLGGARLRHISTTKWGHSVVHECLQTLRRRYKVKRR